MTQILFPGNKKSSQSHILQRALTQGWVVGVHPGCAVSFDLVALWTIHWVRLSLCTPEDFTRECVELGSGFIES